MKTFEHTDKTAEMFNNMLHDYQKIESDGELEKRGLSYDSYKYMGFPIDQLRFDGKTTVKEKDLADYFEKFGFIVNQKEDQYIVKF